MKMWLVIVTIINNFEFTFVSYFQTARPFQLKFWVCNFRVMILQVKQKSKVRKMGPCTFKIAKFEGTLWPMSIIRGFMA